ncbi:hypothetical protein MAPG_10101 [Magnaporthiopsis poae ATCC 64411]|uniref:Uncharacterized protein n=1 Tax=Magnaporthiopsis poae (strain ATCC 64411 / 73-15) TaxID=644358 RepID=A0A0C4EBP7_MAGP6|nr:hypothetical protein MAPG_10101 [Magnaporthiopsis poae ATCC 64411]
MDTPIIHHLEPTPAITGYDRSLNRSGQPASVPRLFIDAMEVREAVFVREQGVAAENELDDDDARSCHWVVYANNTSTSTSTGEATMPLEPIGTLRLVPFPHPPHPVPGGVYFDGRLVGRKDAAGNDVEEEKEVEQEAADAEQGVAGLLVRAALRWMREHPAYFDLSVEAVGGGSDVTPPKWDGLVCCHAQEQVRHVWARFGFEVDEGMGRWWEEGMPHVGMFCRLKPEPLDP